MKIQDRKIKISKERKKGRQSFEMPIEMAEAFGKMGFTQKDIADFLNVTVKTISREFNKQNSEFRDLYNKGRAITAKSLRMKLLQRAIHEDRDQLLVFALKNFCGMSDKMELDNSGEVHVHVTMDGKDIKIPQWLEN
jgi:hypothetical protein